MNTHNKKDCPICLAGLEHSDYWKAQQSGKIPKEKEPSVEEHARTTERWEILTAIDVAQPKTVDEVIRLIKLRA